ncbi:MAG: hypothetical protein ABIN94_22615 [Ferruginibacter sp.]
MNWEVISNDRSSLKEYRMIDNNECKVVIKYNPIHHSARITIGNHHRLFFLESAGSLSGKTIFKNEYGMEIGNLQNDKPSFREGSLVINSEKYLYRLKNGTSPQLSVFEKNVYEPIATCGIPENKNSGTKPTSAITEFADNCCYLLGLCWYISLPSVKENEPEHSSVAF